jgi:hypothetical protein
MNWSKFFSVLEMIGPGVLMAVNPALGFISSDVIAGIKGAQQLPGASGADKLAFVVAQSKTAIADINTAHGSVLVDPTLADTALVAGINTVVATVKLVSNPSQAVAAVASLPALPSVAK